MAIFNSIFKSPTLYHYASLLLLLLLIYYLLIPIYIKIKGFISKKIKKIFPKIGILSGNIVGPVREYKCQRAHTKITSTIWFSKLDESLKSIKLKRLRMIPTSEIDDSFSIIINPFGDIFPEENLKLHTTFYKICDYIKNGGIFVCTGGAFWLHQNTQTSASAEWVIVKTKDDKQSLIDSLLFQEFGIIPTGDGFDQSGNLIFQEPHEVEIYQNEKDKKIVGDLTTITKKIKRFRATTPSSSDYIPLLRQKDNESLPFIARRYGEGYLLHAGIFIDSDSSVEFKLLLEAIKYIVKNKFNNF